MPSTNATVAAALMMHRKRSVEMAAVAAMLTMLYVALAFGLYTTLTARAPGANDLFSRWMGARALFLYAQNPYSDAVTRDIQLGMYGRLARPDQDQVAFAYPLYAAYLAAPLVGLPYSAAEAIWMALLIFCVVGGAIALAVVNRIPLTMPVVLGLASGALAFYPSVRGIFLGQYALVSFALVAACALALAAERPTLAGILLALASVKPQPVIFLTPVILFWAWRNGARRAVWSALATFGVLLGSSFLLVPSWLGDFVRGLGRYAQYAPVGPPLATLFQLLLPETAARGAFVGTAGFLLGWLAWRVWQARARPWLEFQPTLGYAALVTTLIAGRIGTPDQVLLMLWWLARFGALRQTRMRLWILLAAAVLILLPWFAFLMLLDGNKEAIAVTTILPVGTLAVELARAARGLAKRRAWA